MKTWLKGGLIGGSLVAFLSLLMVLAELFQNSSGLNNFFGYLGLIAIRIWLILIFPFAWKVCSSFGSASIFKTCNVGILEYLIGIISYFIIGAIIGLIVSKVKSKK